VGHNLTGCDPAGIDSANDLGNIGAAFHCGTGLGYNCKRELMAHMVIHNCIEVVVADNSFQELQMAEVEPLEKDLH
jgi:hypothetical protein